MAPPTPTRPSRSPAVPVADDDDNEESLALSCPICLELLKSPVLLPCCQQTFCKNCLRQALSSSSSCPLCRAPARMEQCLPNRTLEGLLARRRGCDIESSIPNWPRRSPTNVFMPDHRPRRRSLTLGSVRRWWAQNAPCVRCVCMVATVGVFMLFLRVEEEEYAREAGYLQSGRFHRQTGYLPALSHAPESLRRAKTAMDGARLAQNRAQAASPSEELQSAASSPPLRTTLGVRHA